jgi:hypothetical protein
MQQGDEPMAKGANMQKKLRELARLQPPGSRCFKGNYTSDAVAPEVQEPVRKNFLYLKRKVEKA